MYLLVYNFCLLLPIPVVLLVITLLVKLKGWSLAKSAHAALPAYLLMIDATLILWSDFSDANGPIGTYEMMYMINIFLLAICVSTAAFSKKKISAIAGFIAATGLTIETCIFKFLMHGPDITAISYFIQILFILCLCGLIVRTDKRSEDTPVSADSSAKKKIIHQDLIKASPKLKTGSALKRGIIGAVTGFVMILIISVAMMPYAEISPIVACIYSFAGLLYGFGFTFANWKYVLTQTKVGAIEGASGLTIGLILAHMFKEKKLGLYGWLYFLFRISWHLGLCWIPGIGYGVSAICRELRGEAAETSLLHQMPESSDKVETPSLLCTTGTFKGAEFPLNDDEIITIGSNPSSSQIVLSGHSIQNSHCKIWFDQESCSWCVVNVSGGKIYGDDNIPLKQDILYQLPKGSLLSIGSIEDTHQFRLL